MAYYVFQKNSDNIEGTIYRVAENQSDYNKLNILPELYKVIEDTQTDFDSIKTELKFPIKYNGDIITFINIDPIPKIEDENFLKQYIFNFTSSIDHFLNSNSSHPLYQRLKDYLQQLNQLKNISNTLTYPINKSVQQYFKDNSQPYFNPLQLP